MKALNQEHQRLSEAGMSKIVSPFIGDRSGKMQGFTEFQKSLDVQKSQEVLGQNIIKPGSTYIFISDGEEPTMSKHD